MSRERLVELMDSFVDDVKNGRHRQAGWPESAYRVSKAGLNALTDSLTGLVLEPLRSARRIGLQAKLPP